VKQRAYDWYATLGMSNGQTYINSVTEIDIPMLTRTDSYMTKVVVQHRSPLIDVSVEMVCCEDITLWVEEYGMISTLRSLWDFDDIIVHKRERKRDKAKGSSPCIFEDQKRSN
jgi:hypothetical protein